MPRPSHPSRLNYSNYVWGRVQITKLLIMQFIHSPVTSSLFGLNIFELKRARFEMTQTKHYILETDVICQTQTPWPQSASELYRPSSRPLSAKLVPTFADRGVPRVHLGGSLRPYSRLSRPEPLLFLRNCSSVVLTRLSGPRSRTTTSQKIW
jgi:hypothetical protein